MQADAAQLEFRIAADLARDDLAIDFIRGGGALHQLASEVLGVVRDAAKAKTFFDPYTVEAAEPPKKRNTTRHLRGSVPKSLRNANRVDP